jgi:uncharacterized lipoprotein YajG
MKKLILLSIVLLTTCATDKSIVHREQKVVAERMIVGNKYILRFYDGTSIAVDHELFSVSKENSVVELVWRKKKAFENRMF